MGERSIITGGECVTEQHKNHPTVHVARALAQRGFGVALAPSSRSILHERITVGEEARGIFEAITQTPEIQVLGQLLHTGPLPDLGSFSPEMQKRLLAVRLEYMQKLYDKQAKISESLKRDGAEKLRRASRAALLHKAQVLGGLSELDIPTFVGAVVQREIDAFDQGQAVSVG